MALPASSSSRAKPRSTATATWSARPISRQQAAKCSATSRSRWRRERLQCGESRQAHGVPHRHEQSRRLSRGAEPFLCFRHTAGGARGDAGGGVEALWRGFHDRDRGDRGPLGRELINVPIGPSARARFVPDGRRIVASQPSDAKCARQHLPTVQRDCEVRSEPPLTRSRVRTAVRRLFFLCPGTKPLRCSPIEYAAAEPGSRQSFTKAARSHARAAFLIEVGAPPRCLDQKLANCSGTTQLMESR